MITTQNHAQRMSLPKQPSARASSGPSGLAVQHMRAVSRSSDSARLKLGRTWCEPTTAHETIAVVVQE